MMLFETSYASVQSDGEGVFLFIVVMLIVGFIALKRKPPSASYEELKHKIPQPNQLASKDKKDKDYVQEGIHLTERIAHLSGLTGWQNGTPTSYTQEETQAIARSLSQFQQIANHKIGGEAVFHREIVGELQRQCTVQALEGLVFAGRSESKDWQDYVSTCLKAWICGLNPHMLLQMAPQLVEAGYRGEAKQAFEVVLLYPKYNASHLKLLDDILERYVTQAQEGLQYIANQPVNRVGSI